jgi:hypothetical protein
VKEHSIPPTILSAESARAQIREAEERYRRQLAGQFLDPAPWIMPVAVTKS